MFPIVRAVRKTAWGLEVMDAGNESISICLWCLVHLAQVGSHDLTLVNLHLATLTLPGGENLSKNHGDSHRWASFTQTLQETLKGRNHLSVRLG